VQLTDWMEFENVGRIIVSRTRRTIWWKFRKRVGNESTLQQLVCADDVCSANWKLISWLGWDRGRTRLPAHELQAGDFDVLGNSSVAESFAEVNSTYVEISVRSVRWRSVH